MSPDPPETFFLERMCERTMLEDPRFGLFGFLSLTLAAWIPSTPPVRSRLLLRDSIDDLTLGKTFSGPKGKESDQVVQMANNHQQDRSQRRPLRARSEDGGGRNSNGPPAGQNSNTPNPVSPSPKDYMPFMTESQRTEFLQASEAIPKYHLDRSMADEQIRKYKRIKSKELRDDVNYGKACMTKWVTLRYRAIKDLVASDKTRPEWNAYWDRERAKGRDRMTRWRAELSEEAAEARRELRRIQARAKRARRAERIAVLESQLAKGIALDIEEQKELEQLKGQRRAETNSKKPWRERKRQQVKQERATLEAQIRNGRYSVEEFQRWEELIPAGSRAKQIREMKEFRVQTLEAKDPSTLTEQERDELVHWKPEVQAERNRIKERKQEQNRISNGKRKKVRPGGDGSITQPGQSSAVNEEASEGNHPNPSDSSPQQFSRVKIPYPFTMDGVQRRYDQLRENVLPTLLHQDSSVQLGQSARKALQGVIEHAPQSIPRISTFLKKAGVGVGGQKIPIPKQVMMAP
ncbi:MAG: hypothetical protein M1823_005851 [Watsoniomyces obsoletus]|nr:MAG: hypothetical protein M1823_005851 [Watsoniomyces obsoletus]